MFKINDKIPWQTYYFIINQKKYKCNKLNEFLYDDIIELFLLFKDKLFINNQSSDKKTVLITHIEKILERSILSNISLIIQDCDNNNIVAFILGIDSNDHIEQNIFCPYSENIKHLYKENESLIFRYFYSNGNLNANIIAQCTNPKYQNMGFGKILRNQFIKRCKEKGYSMIKFHTINPYMEKIWLTNSIFKSKKCGESNYIEGSIEKFI